VNWWGRGRNEAGLSLLTRLTLTPSFCSLLRSSVGKPSQLADLGGLFLFLFLVSSCFWREGRKEETMYVHGTGIVDNDYNAAFDSFGQDLYVL
jgi:hypothetical protein